MNTFEIENKYSVPFFNKTQVAVAYGKGVYFWDEQDRKYLDFTSGWGVTSIGHAHPVITEALTEQSRKVIQNPNSGLLYSPARAKLLELMAGILPAGITKIFFSNSGAEANDAAIKIARKISGKKNIISTKMSFHGRTISTMSATGQQKFLDRFRPLMPNYTFVPYNNVQAIKDALDNDTAAVIVEPIQGEGGVNVPDKDYLEKVSAVCQAHGVYLIVDEIQTGFYRTGPAFQASNRNIQVDFLTMAKGIAGGFPIGAFAVTDDVARKIAIGDHGGTYCGNPLGCAVAYAVIKYIIDNNTGQNVADLGAYTLQELQTWKQLFNTLITDVRGAGLLLAIEFSGEDKAMDIEKRCLAQGLLLNRIQGRIIRIFPALNITRNELDEGLKILKEVIRQTQD